MSWPKVIKAFLHADDHRSWEMGHEIGLSQKSIVDNFRDLLYEVEFEVEVNEDGTYQILSIKDGSDKFVPEKGS